MKKIFLLLGAVSVFTACHNDDDDNPSTEVSILGDWQMTKREVISGKDQKTVIETNMPNDCEKKSTTKLQENGEATIITYQHVDSNCQKESETTYTYVYDDLTKSFVITNIEDETVQPYKVLALTTTTLQLEDLLEKDYDNDGIKDTSITYYKKK